MGVAEEQRRILAGHDAADPAVVIEDAGVGVSVPATSANLGPGYDSFGVALDISLIAVSCARQERRIIPRGLGGEELPTGDENLVWQAVRSWCDFAGTTPPEVSVVVDSAIPLQRGMGSSSAAAVAGVLLGRALTGGTASTEQVLGLAADLEGHPDNAAAALVGGLVVCDDQGGFLRVTPTGGLRPVVIVPSQRQATGEARAVLPREVPLGVAAANGARAAATFAGLAGLTRLRSSHMADALHEPARFAMMPTSSAVVEALRAQDIPCALSGAGPSVLAILPSQDDGAVDRLRGIVAEALTGDARTADASPVEVVPTAWHLAGATVCPPDRAGGPAG